MAHSPLLGAERAATRPEGFDTERLGPGDNSDSGSDMMGLEDGDTADPTMPVDVALDGDRGASVQTADSLGGGATDAFGTGERRSAGNDAGQEAADIGVDRVFTVDEDGREIDADDEDADDDPAAGVADAADLKTLAEEVGRSRDA